jgi:hypothetical protein
MAAAARVGHAAARRSAGVGPAVCRSRSSTPVPGAVAREPTTVANPSPVPLAQRVRIASAAAAAPSSVPTTWTAPMVLVAAVATPASKARSTALATSFDRWCHARARPTAHWALTARTPYWGGFAFQSASSKEGASPRCSATPSEPPPRNASRFAGTHAREDPIPGVITQEEPRYDR